MNNTFNSFTDADVVDSEKALLGCLMLSPEAVETTIQTGVLGEMFASPRHESIFDAMLELAGSTHAPLDVIMVGDYLRSRNLLDKNGGVSYLHECLAAPTSAVLTPQYAENVKKAHTRRALNLKLTAAMNSLREGMETEAVVAAISAAVDDATFTETSRTPAPAHTALDETLNVLDGHGSGGVPTGLEVLDEKMGGLRRGSITIIAGRPGTGKTVAALTIADNMSRAGTPVMVYSLEISRVDMVLRLISARCTIDSKRLNPVRPALWADDWERISEFAPAFAEQPLYVGADNYTVETVCSQARVFARKNPDFVLFVDYLQLLETATVFTSENAKLSYISRSLKLLALELNIPVVLLSQLNREVESRGDKQPLPSDLRGSGSIEQDADNVLLLYREDMYDKESIRAGEVDIIIGKHRGGSTGTVTVAAQMHYYRFRDMARN